MLRKRRLTPYYVALKRAWGPLPDMGLLGRIIARGVPNSMNDKRIITTSSDDPRALMAGEY